MRAAAPTSSPPMDLFTNRLLWLGASARALSLRGSALPQPRALRVYEQVPAPSDHPPTP
jgi:hypothetical protein